MRNVVTPFRRAAVCAALLVSSTVAAQAAAMIFTVTVDTSSVQSSSGFLDFQFNPGNASSQSAAATIDFFTGGTFTPTPDVTGDVSGQLPGTLTINNTTALNEYFEQFLFGTSFTFQLTLSGPAIDSPDGISTAGSTFGLGLYDSSQNPILTDASVASGFAAQVDILLDGTTQVTTYPNGGSVVNFTQVQTPEPSALGLFALSCAGLILVRRYRSV